MPPIRPATRAASIAARRKHVPLPRASGLVTVPTVSARPAIPRYQIVAATAIARCMAATRRHRLPKLRSGLKLSRARGILTSLPRYARTIVLAARRSMLIRRQHRLPTMASGLKVVPTLAWLPKAAPFPRTIATAVARAMAGRRRHRLPKLKSGLLERMRYVRWRFFPPKRPTSVVAQETRTSVSAAETRRSVSAAETRRTVSTTLSTPLGDTVATDVVLKQGETAPIDFTLANPDKTPANLTGCTVQMTMSARDTAVVVINKRAVPIKTPASGIVTYTPLVADSAVVGQYDVEFLATYPDGSTVEFPNGGYFPLAVFRKLA